MTHLDILREELPQLSNDWKTYSMVSMDSMGSCEAVWAQREGLTAEERPVEGELLRQVLDVGNALVHGAGQVVGVVEAAQDDAGEVDGLCKVAHERALDPHHVPPAGRPISHETHSWLSQLHSSTDTLLTPCCLLLFSVAAHLNKTCTNIQALLIFKSVQVKSIIQDTFLILFFSRFSL